MEPLDPQQERRLAELRQGRSIRTRRGTILYCSLMGALLPTGVVIGLAQDGVPLVALLLGVLAFAVVGGVLGVVLGPDRLLRGLVRFDTPSSAQMEEGVRAFQINAGRAWKTGEKPPPHYWDNWR